jgi:hypothetical protein
MAEQLRGAVLSTLAVEIGAAGFATLFVASLFDLTLIVPSAVAVAALAIMPYRCT